MDKAQLKSIVTEAVEVATMSWIESQCGFCEVENAAQIVDKIMAAIEEYTRETDRKKFAGLAMNGLLASYSSHNATTPEDISRSAVQISNALINELEKPKS